MASPPLGIIFLALLFHVGTLVEANWRDHPCVQTISLLDLADIPLTLELLPREEEHLLYGSLTYKGLGWVGFAINPRWDGYMVGSWAVIGEPALRISRYYLGGYWIDTMELQSYREEETEHEKILQNQTHTTLTFAIPMESDDYTIHIGGTNRFLVAAGSSNEFRYHDYRYPLDVTLAVECEEPQEIVEEPTEEENHYDCTLYQHSWSNNNDKTSSLIHLDYVVSQDLFRGRVTYEGLGWVGLAVSPNGQMVGSHAVIGLPNDDSVRRYYLGGYSLDQVTVAQEDQQGLVLGEVVQNNTHTVLTLELSLESFAIDPFGNENHFLLAAGSSNDLYHHAAKERLTLALAPCDCVTSFNSGNLSIRDLPGGDESVDATIRYELGTDPESGSTTFSAEVVYQGQGWIALAISENGKSRAVIGHVDEANGATNHNLGPSYSPFGDEAVLLGSESLLAKDIQQNQTHTVLSFTVWAQGVLNPRGENHLEIAAGNGNTPRFRQGFPLSLNYYPSCSDSTLLQYFGLADLAVGDRVNVTGYIMDEFCIANEFLYDDPTVRTLQHPEKHSIHCLVDVPQCADSNYELLLDPAAAPTDTLYRRGFVLDDGGKALVQSLARQLGECSTCLGQEQGDHWNLGFRAQIIGSVQELGQAVGQPHLLAVEHVTAKRAIVQEETEPIDVHNSGGQNLNPTDCSQYQSTIDFRLAALTLNYVVNVDEDGVGTLSAQVVYKGQGWLGFGISADGRMVDSLAVIGIPSVPIGPANPGKYALNAKSTNGAVLLPEEQQTLLDGQVYQDGTHTVLTFTKLLSEPGELAIDPNGWNNFLVAAGDQNELGSFHKSHASARIRLSPCTSDGIDSLLVTNIEQAASRSKQP